MSLHSYSLYGVAAYEKDIRLIKKGNKKSVPCKQSTPRNVPHLLSHKTILNMEK